MTRWVVRLFAAALLTLLLSEAVLAQARVDNGRALSMTHCARCHVVSSDNRYGGIGSTPSFRLLSKRDDYLERFQTFYARRPHPVFVRVPNVPAWTDIPSPVAVFTITPEEIEDIIAYVETLRPR